MIQQQKLALPTKLRFYFLGIFLLWTLIVGIYARKEYNHAEEHMIELVLQEARIFCDQNLVLRQWVSSHKGVYVELNSNTPPNPMLSQLPERDIISPSGRKLTVMNLAYVLRQVNAQFAAKYGAIGHITSLRPKSSKNKAHPWEDRALHSFAKGEKEFAIIPDDEGKEPCFRFMKPLMIQKECVPCHTQQGFIEGGIAGGASVSIPMAPFLEAKNQDWAIYRNKFLLFYLLGSSALFMAYLFSASRARKFITVQQQLQESELKYRTLFENTPEAVYWVASDASFVNVNQAATTLLGYSKTELLTMNITDITSEVTMEDWPSIWHDLQNGETFRRVGNHQKKDGRLVPIHNTSTIVRIGAQDYACSVVRDLSLEKEAAEQLRNSERRWQDIFMESPISLWEEDLSLVKLRIDQLQEQGVEDFQTYFAQHPKLIGEFADMVKVINVNKATLALYKANFSDVLNKGLSSVLGQESLDVFRDEILTLIRGETHFEADVVNMTLTGEKLYVIIAWELSDVYLKDWSHLIISVQDITLRRKAEKKASENLSQLAHAGRLSSLGEMATSVAHELNQPLHIISLITENMQDSLTSGDTQELKIPLLDIMEQIRRATKIITSMRAFAQKGTTDSTLIEVEALTSMALSFFTEQFRNHGIELSLDKSPNLPKIQADPQKIEQIIINLLTNARHAVESKNEHHLQEQTFNETPLYRMQVQVHLWANPQTKQLVIAVEDNGIGMTEETIDHCLDPFFSLNRTEKGTGLGLSIVHNLTTEFGGKIDITSQLHKMTKIQISFPGIF